MSIPALVEALESANPELADIRMATEVLADTTAGGMLLKDLSGILRKTYVGDLTPEQRNAATFLFNAALRGDYQHTARAIIGDGERLARANLLKRA